MTTTIMINIDENGNPVPSNYKPKVQEGSEVKFVCGQDFTIEFEKSTKLTNPDPFSSNPSPKIGSNGRYSEKATVGDRPGTYTYKISLTNQTDSAFEDPTPPMIIVGEVTPLPEDA